MATFTFEGQRVIIRFIHLRGMKPIEIHQQLSETCNGGVMDVKNVRSWVRQFKEGQMMCENNLKDPQACTSRSEDIIVRVEQRVMEDRRLTVKQRAANAGISVGSVDTILHDDFNL
jgi:predicted HicB family RNase H-like nuclease